MQNTVSQPVLDLDSNHIAFTPKQPPPILVYKHQKEKPASPPHGCGSWNGLDNCQRGDIYNFPDSAESRRWQTPPKGSRNHHDSFQDYHDLVGYADIQYSSDRKVAAIVVNAASRTGDILTYSFNGKLQKTNIFYVPANMSEGVDVIVRSASGHFLTLDRVYLAWQAPSIKVPTRASFVKGQKGAIVELFGWPFEDIAKECSFLGKASYMGVKVWPVTEHLWGSNIYESNANGFRPWYLL